MMLKHASREQAILMPTTNSAYGTSRREQLSKKELCEAIQKHLPDFLFIEAPIGKDPDQRNYIVSNQKIEATGFKPAHSLDFGIR